MNLFCVVSVLCLAGISEIQGASIAEDAQYANLYEPHIGYMREELGNLLETYTRKWSDVIDTFKVVDEEFMKELDNEHYYPLLNKLNKVEAAEKEQKNTTSGSTCETVKHQLEKNHERIDKERSECKTGYADYVNELQLKLNELTHQLKSIDDLVSKIIPECEKSKNPGDSIKDCFLKQLGEQVESAEKLERSCKLINREITIKTNKLKKCYSELFEGLIPTDLKKCTSSKI